MPQLRLLTFQEYFLKREGRGDWGDSLLTAPPAHALSIVQFVFFHRAAEYLCF